MKRKNFLLTAFTALSIPAFITTVKANFSNKNPFKVATGKSRFGDTVKFIGVHPTDLKVSSKDTDSQLSVFEFTGKGITGPQLHIHFNQDEIFYVVEGEYRFVVGDQTHVLKAGETIFLPRNIAHTWLQLSEHGKLVFFLQPAGKMEEFFSFMNSLKGLPSPEEFEKIHQEYDMSVLGPPLKR